MDPLIQKELDHNPARFKQFTLAAIYESQYIYDQIVRTTKYKWLTRVIFGYKSGVELYVWDFDIDFFRRRGRENSGCMHTHVSRARELIRQILYRVKNENIKYEFIGLDDADLTNWLALHTHSLPGPSDNTLWKACVEHIIDTTPGYLCLDEGVPDSVKGMAYVPRLRIWQTHRKYYMSQKLVFLSGYVKNE